MSSVQTTPCTICKYAMNPVSAQFYCCNRNERYCILCRSKNCIRCNRPVEKQCETAKCKICYVRAEDDQLMEPQCEASYCARCVVSRVIKMGRTGDRAYYMLPCGHQLESEKVQGFIKGKFCKVCGRKYDTRSDYDLLDGNKCCFECFKFQKKRIEGEILQCMGCGKVLRKVTEVGSNINEGIVLCYACAKDSCLEEERCEIEKGFKKVEEKKMVDNYIDNYQSNNQIQGHQGGHSQGQPKQEQQPQPQPQQQNKQKPDTYQIKIHATKPPEQPNKSPLKQQSTSNSKPTTTTTSKPKPQRKSPSPIKVNFNYSNTPNSPRNVTGNIKAREEQKRGVEVSANLFPGINQSDSTLNSSSSTSGSQQPQQKITILQEFPPERDDLVSPLPKLSIKKHMSMETYIEKMKIEIEPNVENQNPGHGEGQQGSGKLITCKECNYDLLQAEAFTIENAVHEMSHYCRLCYTIITNKQLLGFNMMPVDNRLDKSRNTRGLSNQRHKIPTNLLNSTTDTKNPTPTLLSPYTTSTTYTSHPTQQNPMKKSDTLNQYPTNTYHNLNLNQSPNYPKNNYQKMTGTVRVSASTSSASAKECALCQAKGASMITTGDRGTICFTCYYAKRK